MVSIYEYRLLEVRCTAFGTILIARKMTSLSDLGCVECYWRCVVVARFVAVWRPAVWGERWLFSPPQRPLCFVARVRRVGRRKKESALWQMQLAIGFCFKNEQTLELLVPYPPYRGVCLKGLGRVSAISVWLAIQHVRLMEVVLKEHDDRKKRTAKRLCVTNVTRLFLACFVVIFSYYCVLVLFKGEWSLAENFQILFSRFTL